MSNPSFFAGGDGAATEREEARRVALSLARAHSELGYHVLFSAASYLLRTGQRPRDGAVLSEARRRMRMVHRAVERNRRRFQPQTNDQGRSPRTDEEDAWKSQTNA